MYMNTSLFERVRHMFVTLGVVAMVFAIPTWAQDEDEDAAELGRVEVTGSRLNQVDVETAQPVTVISREDIELSGFATVAEVLQNTPYNSFGSFRETSGYANGQATVNEISLRGLGSNRTLVLMDGRRIAPTGGSGAAAQNLNQIPTAIIERIEILRDGASAVYGSDAIAGVINVITRKDFDGLDFSVTSGATEVGGGDYTRASLTSGVSNSKGNIFFTFQHYDRRPQYWNETDYAYANDYDYWSSFSFPSTTYISGMGAAYVNDQGYNNTNAFGSPTVDADGNFIGYKGYFVDPRCPDTNVGSQYDRDGSRTTDDRFPNAYNWGKYYYGWTSWCGYDFAQDIMSIPRAKRNAFLLKGTYDLSPDVTLNTQLGFSMLDGDTRFAGTPITAPYPTMKANNPNHPLYAYYGTVLNADGTYSNGINVPAGAYNPRSPTLADGVTPNPNYFSCTDPKQPSCGDVTFYMRTVPNGTRDNTVTENILDFRMGLEGVADIMGGLSWEANIQVINNDIDNQTINLVNKVLLQAGLDQGLVDPFGINTGTIEEIYAQFLPYNHTGLYQADLKYLQGDFVASFDIGELAGGPIGMVVGVEYAHSSFDQLNDPESNALQVAGSAGGDNINAERSRKAAFIEVGLPFTDELNVSLAGRYDDYSTSGIGSNFSPSINFAYRPFSWVLLRGTYGEGFRVGAFDEIYGNQSESFPSGVDRVGCANGVAVCTVTQYRTLAGGNTELGPEESEHYTLGLVLSPLPELTVQVGAWHTEYTGYITTNSLQREFNAEFRGETNYVYRLPNGTVDYVSLQYNNFNGVEAEGIDFDVSYTLDTDSMGRFDFAINAAKYTKYIVQAYEDSARVDTAGQVGLPDLRLNPSIRWGKGDWSVALTGYHMEGQRSTVDEADTIDDHFEMNLYISYDLPWDANIALGAINVTDEAPETNGDIYGWEPLDYTLYSTAGRTVYISYQQSL